MQVDVYKKDGTLSGEKVTLNPEVFGIEPNDHAIYQAVRSIQANRRQGTHKVKPRNEVRGGGKKPYRQKKTGRARAGTMRSPLMVGGGSIFGPHPHDYAVKLPEKVRKLARRSALSSKAKSESIMVVEDFSFEAPKTRELAAVLKALSLGGKKTLMLTAASDPNVLRSGRNIERLSIQEAAKASTFEILNSQVLLIHRSALGRIEGAARN